ncbi:MULTISPECIES: DUF3085 domain-containing protein [unclassified Streptomyces]|uniref:DUF3085 domain-containing protein n=1 Tax=unclassified Streptomyces TaxID=2593676 RepID=UPI00093BA9FC|nr:DUF3085 domain-containing protein [Streptomyces sp. CB01883]OKJ74444.1 hypothetical protein AMK32_36340 [Streptomyces sp. CB01883]
MPKPTPAAPADVAVSESFDVLLREVLDETSRRPTPDPDCTLTFDLGKVLTAAEHALNSTRHALGPGDTRAYPALWWISGDGTYLMSNGIRRTPNTRVPHGHWPHIVYADGWGPDTQPSTLLGDDHHETLDLTHSTDGPPLITLLRTAHTDGATRCLLHLPATATALQLTLTTE